MNDRTLAAALVVGLVVILWVLVFVARRGRR